MADASSGHISHGNSFTLSTGIEVRVKEKKKSSLALNKKTEKERPLNDHSQGEENKRKTSDPVAGGTHLILSH